jgi:hypothetical protein
VPVLPRLRSDDGMTMAPTPRASATMTAFGEVELTFPFSEALREALKAEIPGRYRKWDPDDKVWRVMGAYAPAAIDLLLEHFPRAEVPGDQPRRIPSSPARKEKPAVPLPPLSSLDGARGMDDQPARDHLVASVRCPKCHAWHDQPIRVVAEASLTVAKREQSPPELVAVCPGCNVLMVVSFFPAPVEVPALTPPR